MIIDYTAMTKHGEKIECTFMYYGEDGEESAYLEKTFGYRNVKIIAKRAVR